MSKLLVSCIPSKTVPEKYVCPPEKRAVPAEKIDIPIIDLQDKNSSTSAIMKASLDWGIFLVINHGIPIEVMNKAMKIFDEFFKLPIEEKTKYPIESDTTKICRVYTSTYNYDTEEFHCWKDCLRVECTSLDKCIEFWPQNPHNFREVVEEYVRGVKGLRLRLLEHISEGLGLEREYLGGELSKGVALAVNHYPPSPNPDLTVGQPEHTDPTVITIAHGGNIPAFQIIKDGQWFTVETPPQGFLVFMGSQIEVISNGKLKALQHRAASTRETRYTAIFFINPSPECIVEPAKAILEAENRSSLYKSYKYEDFYKAHVGPKPKGKGYFYDDVVENLQTNLNKF